MNLIKHIEIAGVDGPKLESFYTSLLGWQIKRTLPGGFEYGEIQTNQDFTAGIRHEPEGKAEIVLYIEVADLEATVGRAVELGAKIRIPPMDGGEIRFALLEDPEGNPIGFTQPQGAHP